MNKNNVLSKIINNKKYMKIIYIVGITAVILIFISSFVNINQFTSQVDTEEYTQNLESQLLAVISKIDGVGRVEVFLTMDNSGENVYLENSDTKTKSITPVVRGVVVVCDGGDNPVIVSRVMSAVTKALDISTNKVCVTKLTN